MKLFPKNEKEPHHLHDDGALFGRLLIREFCEYAHSNRGIMYKSYVQSRKKIAQIKSKHFQ